jgi:uncharacterized protein (TIGR00251 family)
VAKAEAKPKEFVRHVKDGVYVQLRVSPGAKSTAITGLYGERALKLSVAAPPSEGRANTEVEHYLARLLELSRSEVAVVKGGSSRDKLVFVRGVEPDEIRTRLNTLL